MFAGSECAGLTATTATDATNRSAAVQDDHQRGTRGTRSGREGSAKATEDDDRIREYSSVECRTTHLAGKLRRSRNGNGHVPGPDRERITVSQHLQTR